MVRIASYNVENLFTRPRAFHTADWSIGQPILEAYSELNDLFQLAAYSPADKTRMRDLMVVLDLYYINSQGAVRRKYTSSPRWAWFRKNRGVFDRQPSDNTLNIEIEAAGRDDWIGWVELAVEPTDDLSVRMTARVFQEVDADIVAVVEAENRPSLVRFNRELLADMYEHVMLVDGNDDRGIDVGIMTRSGFEIESIRSNVDSRDAVGLVFSRDCPQYAVRTPSGLLVHVLINHFKSQSGGGDEKRRRQSLEVRRIVDGLVSQGQHVIVLGDLNEGPAVSDVPAPNLVPLYENNSPLVDCYTQPAFQVGNRDGTFDSCGLRNRFDYIFFSRSLSPALNGGEVFRKGLWGSRKTRPTTWETYPEITRSSQQASDHALLYIDLDI